MDATHREKKRELCATYLQAINARDVRSQIESTMEYGWTFMEERDPEWCDIFSEDDDTTRKVRRKNRWMEYDRNPMGFLRDYRREHCYLCGCEPCVWRELKVFSVAEEREQQKEYSLLDPKKRRVRMVEWATQQLRHRGLLVEEHADGVPLCVIQGIGKSMKVPKCLEQGTTKVVSRARNHPYPNA
jgi:hypothetical protein